MLITPAPRGVCVMANPPTPEDRPRWRWPLCYGALLVVAVPWYWPPGNTPTWLGMPVWTLVSIGASVLVSILVSWQLARPWRDEGADDQRGSDA